MSADRPRTDAPTAQGARARAAASFGFDSRAAAISPSLSSRAAGAASFDSRPVVTIIDSRGGPPGAALAGAAPAGSAPAAATAPEPAAVDPATTTELADIDLDLTAWFDLEEAIDLTTFDLIPPAAPVDVDAVDPAATIKLSAEAVAALIADAAAERAPAATRPPARTARTYWSAATAADLTAPGSAASLTAAGPVTGATAAPITELDGLPPGATQRQHRGLLTAPLLWGVLATGLLMVAFFYALSVAMRASGYGP